MKTWTVEFELTGNTRAPGLRRDTYEGTLAEAKAAFAEDVHRYGGRIKYQNWTKEDHSMKTNHTADEVVTIEGPHTHSLDIERVRTVIDDEMHRVGTVYVTFHFVHNGKHRTHSDDFKPSDKWFPVIEELFDEVTAVYKVTIQPSDKLGKAKGNPSHFGIQHQTFHDGGGVLHRIPFEGNFLSAWFDSSGNLLDVEGRTPQHRTINVGTAARAQAQRIGRAYFPALGGEPKENPRAAAPADEVAAHELALVATNDGDLYRRQLMPIIRNLAKKKRDGVYKRELAIKAFEHAALSAAKAYDPSYGTIFTPATRRLAAAEMLDYYEEHINELAEGRNRAEILENPVRGKITGDDFDVLRQAIASVIGHLPDVRAAVARDPRVKDPEMRARWDLLWTAKRAGSLPSDWFNRVYKYADDTHIDTALRSIIKSSPLENPREHRRTSPQGHYVANLLRNPVTATGSRYSSDEPDESAEVMSHL